MLQDLFHFGHPRPAFFVPCSLTDLVTRGLTACTQGIGHVSPGLSHFSKPSSKKRAERRKGTNGSE